MLCVFYLSINKTLDQAAATDPANVQTFTGWPLFL